MLDVCWAGHQWTLFAEKAAYLPAWRALLVADPHFGKAEHFRRSGVPVPGGTTAEMIARLDRLIEVTSPLRVVVLGDLLHSKGSTGEGLWSQLRTWRRRQPCEVVNVRGNHDRVAGDPPAELGMGCVARLTWENLEFVHDPAEAEPRQAGTSFRVAGHVHPAVHLGVGGDRMRLPCFHASKSVLTLPAFGAFTGCANVRPAAGDLIWAVAPDAVVAVSPGIGVSQQA